MSASVATDEQPPVALQLPVDLEGEIIDEASCYWDASTMAPLNAASAAAIARLRAYKPPPFPLWDRLPLSRRAAVLMLLYADKRGDLRVVITMRAASLRSFSGHAALPGGKADSLEETPYQIARREAWEEIGLPMDDTKIPAPFRIEHLCYLPMNLARTELVVRPCVAFLHTTDPPVPTSSITANNTTSSSSSPSPPPPSPSPQTQTSTSTSTLNTSPTTVEESLIPRLDAKEVAAVFSAPFHNFLKSTDEEPNHPREGWDPTLPPGVWYEGSWTAWHDHAWRMHFFYVPVANQKVVKPLPKGGKNRKKEVGREEEGRGLAALGEDGNGNGSANGSGEGGTRVIDKKTEEAEEKKDEVGEVDTGRYKVWGMTARMLVDAATIAYGEEPEFEHNKHFGDEKMILTLADMGRLTEKKRAGSVLSSEGLKKAREAVAEAEGEKRGKNGTGGNGSGKGSKM